MGIVESVKKGFNVAKGSMPLVGLLFGFGFFWNVVNIILSSKLDPANPAVSGMVIAMALVFIFLTIFMQAGSLGYVRDKIKQGSAGLPNFISSGGKYYVRLLIIALVVVAVIFTFVLLAALFVSLFKESLAPVGVVLALLLAALGIYFVVLFFLAPYIAVGGEQTAIASLKQSIPTVRKNILKLLGIFLVLIAIGFVSGLVLGAAFAGLSLLVQGTASQMLFALLSSFINAFLGVLVTASFMGFYLSMDHNTSA